MANVYNEAKKRLVDAALDLDAAGATIRCMLLQAAGIEAFEPDDATVSAVLAGTNVELTVGGYARQTLGSQATAKNDAADQAEASANKATFASLASGQTIAVAHLQIRVGTADADATDPPLSWYDVTDTPTNGGDVEIRWSGTDGVGIFLTVG